MWLRKAPVASWTGAFQEVKGRSPPEKGTGSDGTPVHWSGQVMNVDIDQVRMWLDLLHGDSSGFVHVCASGDWTGQVCESTEQALAYVNLQDHAGRSGIYLRATTVKGKLLPGSRGGEKDTACLAGLWADLDIAGPGHRTTKPLPPTEEDAREIITKSGLPEPTMWVHSGGGLYPWWMLVEPHCTEDLDQARMLTTGWNRIIEFSASRLGWHYGTEVADLARVLRIPGTVNRKIPDDPRMCLVSSGGSGVNYPIADLFEAMAEGTRKIPLPEPVQVRPSSPTQSEGDRPGDVFESEPWDSPLLLHDWEVHHQAGDTTYWTRPGKSRRDGWSATTGHAHDQDRLYVFSSATQFEPQVPYSKFAAYCLLSHGGDYSAAARELRRAGYGAPLPVQAGPDPFVPTLDPPGSVGPATVVTGPVVEGRVVNEPARWQAFSWDDIGNAVRFATRYSDRVRRLTDVEKWAYYLNGRWNLDSGDRTIQLAQLLINDLVELEGGLASDREDFMKWWNKQRSSGKVLAMISMARGQGTLHVQRDDFDSDPMLLNCRNGTLDLRSGTLLPHDPAHLLMEQANVDWESQAQCPMWLAYLDKTVPDPATRQYLQQVAGYTLTGDVSEQAMFIHYGFGANGKSVFLEVLGSILGSYSIVVDPATLLARKLDKTTSEDIARMKGMRLLRASETNVGKHLDEGQVKLLTGGDDRITARKLYENSFDFRPTGKIHLICNHIPSISNAESTWRRLNVIGWDVTIAEGERDRKLAQRILFQERSGILAWAVRGCLDWQQQGLAPPVSVRMRTDEYRVEQDPVGEFANECLKPSLDPLHIEPSSRIYLAYRSWCDSNGARHMSGKALSMALQEHGLHRVRTNMYKGFQGVQAITPLQAQLSWDHGSDYSP